MHLKEAKSMNLMLKFSSYYNFENLRQSAIASHTNYKYGISKKQRERWVIIFGREKKLGYKVTEIKYNVIDIIIDHKPGQFNHVQYFLSKLSHFS